MRTTAGRRALSVIGAIGIVAASVQGGFTAPLGGPQDDVSNPMDDVRQQPAPPDNTPGGEACQTVYSERYCPEGTVEYDPGLKKKFKEMLAKQLKRLAAECVLAGGKPYQKFLGSKKVDIQNDPTGSCTKKTKNPPRSPRQPPRIPMEYLQWQHCCIYGLETAKPTPMPTAKPTRTPTSRPTATATAKPTNAPTPRPTGSTPR